MPKAIDLNDMMLFIELVDAGSFTAAAERLNLPKANLSRKIARLEQRLGITLLERTTRTQRLTEAGKTYLQYCRRIQQEVDMAEGALDQLVNTARGTLKVGVSVGIGQFLLKDMLGEFLIAHPDVVLDLKLTNQRVDLIEEGYDLLIRVGELADSRLIGKRLGQIRRHLYASPRYFMQATVPKVSADLSEHTFLVMNRSQDHNQLTLTDGQKTQTLMLSPRAQVDDFLVLKQMLIDGLGIAVLPDYMCIQEVQTQQLLPVLPEWEVPSVELYALFPQHRQKLPKVSLFLTHIQQAIARHLA